MTKREFLDYLDQIPWFDNVGEPSDSMEDVLLIRSLDFLAGRDSLLDSALSSLEWFPTVRDQADPFGLEVPVSNEDRETALAAYRVTLAALRRHLPNSKLKAGPHDFNEAARGGGAYAARCMGKSIAMGWNTGWRPVLDIFSRGHWPLGRLADGRIVVY